MPDNPPIQNSTEPKEAVNKEYCFPNLCRIIGWADSFNAEPLHEVGAAADPLWHSGEPVREGMGAAVDIRCTRGD